MVAPYFGKMPDCSTSEITPSSFKIGMLAGSNDSPTWSLGKLALSKRITLNPLRANIVATVVPAGPPPTTTIWVLVLYDPELLVSN